MSMKSKRRRDDLKEQHLFLRTHFSFSFFVHGFLPIEPQMPSTLNG